jgi:hypothetical protein
MGYWDELNDFFKHQKLKKNISNKHINLKIKFQAIFVEKLQ